jgi:hypothetical protein
MMTSLAAFAYGTLGGVLVKIVGLAELASVPRIERPPTFSDPLWVFNFCALPLVGGILTYAYHEDGAVLKPLLAMNIGLSAPLILKTLAAVVPKDMGRVN